MCCTRLAKNTGRKKDAKIGHLRTIAQFCRTISSQLRHVSTIGKTVKQQYLLHVSSQYGELRPTNGRGLEHLSKLQLGFASWLRYCSDVSSVATPVLRHKILIGRELSRDL